MFGFIGCSVLVLSVSSQGTEGLGSLTNSVCVSVCVGGCVSRTGPLFSRFKGKLLLYLILYLYFFLKVGPKMFKLQPPQT